MTEAFPQETLSARQPLAYYSMMRLRGNNAVSYILFAIGIIQFLTGLASWVARHIDQEMNVPLLGWVLYNCQCGTFSWLDWVFSLSGIAYVALGIAARRVQTTPALFGAGIYVGLLGLQATQSLDLLWTGLVTKIAVAYLLLAATMVAFRRPFAPASASPLTQRH